MGVSSDYLEIDFVVANVKHNNIKSVSARIEDEDVLPIFQWKVFMSDPYEIAEVGSFNICKTDYGK